MRLVLTLPAGSPGDVPVSAGGAAHVRPTARSLLALSIVLACCGRGNAAEAKPMPTEPLKWTMTQGPDRKTLVVEATFHNTTGQRLYLADRLVTSAGGNKLKRSDRLTVMNSDDPTVARFVLGVTSSESPLAQGQERHPHRARVRRRAGALDDGAHRRSAADPPARAHQGPSGLQGRPAADPDLTGRDALRPDR